ncbi:potassium transporter KefG [Pseudoalteromonas luteoviolacea]|uniref:Potassium transporter KefG n=1 Tax=Pseudoalteromonas luteoviolacea TaxID=43657 RepID=A0A1C0TW03_9GAMM|nr:NAD(P)H-dependent oxidoreductase [Pseudoalteromonas luteoviolacea]OCQ23512.1 potassium transporter KefG [Pseudoalteromonas luteoviolacea]
MKKNRILLLFAHPSQHRSNVNAPLFEYAKSLDYVTAVDLYAKYPTYQIDIDDEQQLLNAHDVVIFQFPFYWYSTPSILKEWQDLVLEYGYAYGQDGKALQGKLFICAISAGGKEEAYRAKGYNHFTVRELLQPLEQTAYITGMTYLPPFALFSSRSAQFDHALSSHLAQWKLLLQALYHNSIDVRATESLITINELLGGSKTQGDKA